MFRDVPGCSGMFHVPDFIDDPGKTQTHFSRVMCEKTFPMLSRRYDNSRAEANQFRRGSVSGYFFKLIKLISLRRLYSITIKLSENL